jgi:arylsulfatase A-like enzyme
MKSSTKGHYMAKNKSRKSLLLIVVVILAVGAGVWFFMQHRPASPIRHVVLISLDTCRADHLSCYGYKRKTTPNIDALARKGYLFGNTTTTIPLTLPAHTSMFTGTIPPHHGRHENKDPYFDPSHVTLAGLLKEKGYSTGAFVGSQILNGSLGLDRGFDVYDDEFAEKDASERRGAEVNRAAFDWLEKQKNDPVFLFLHYYDPHDEYDPPEPFASKFKESAYAGEIAYADHCIGEVIAKLKKLGMYKSSLIIVTGDHGEMLGEHGEAGHMYFIYESAMKVPMVYKLPESSKGQKIDDIAGIIDIVPTVCDLLGIEPPAPIEGKSLAGYFSDTPVEDEDRYMYCESLYPTKYGGNSLLGLVGEKWKYIQTTRPELYDLEKDPGEETNLVDAERHRVRILKDQLAQILEQSVRKEKGQEDTQLSAEALKHLNSLGYVGGNSVKEDFSFDQTAKDPKDLIGYHEDYRKLSRMMTKSDPSINLREMGDRLIKQRPDFHEIYSALMGVALKQKDYKNLIHYGEQALKVKPGNHDLHQMLGFAYSETKQYEAAAKHYKLGLGFAEKDETDSLTKRVQLHNQLGLMRSKQKKFGLAVAQFRESLKLDGKQPVMLNSYAQALLTSSDPAIVNNSTAMKLAQQACILTGHKNPVYMGTLAVAYATVGNLIEAAKISEKALQLAIATGNKQLIAKQQRQLSLIRRALARPK